MWTKFVVAGLVAAVQANTKILSPPESKGEEAALIWIHGMSCDPDVYTPLATEFQNEMAKAKYPAKTWVALPEFFLDAPNPISIDHYVNQAKKDLTKAGYTGDKYIMAGHSLGGVMAQQYANKHSDTIEGLMLMGSVLERSTHKINADGTTHFDFKVPTLTLAGEKDGLMRVTRVAEAWWHQIENIESAQKNMFPIYTLEGATHWSFGSGKAPSAVRKRDLRPEISDTDAYQAFATNMVNFVESIISPKATYKEQTKRGRTPTDQLLNPMLEAMEMEGFYGMKPPCYNSLLVNPHDITCQHGSPWHEQYSQRLMAGEFPNKKTHIHTDDNFHRVQSVTPIHLAQYNNTCPATGGSKCTLESITVSENIYGNLDKLDTGYYPISASEMKTKMMSRQQSQVAAGVSDADFHVNDEDGNRCADINNAAIQWAKEHASKTALKRYEQLGDQMVTGDDMGPYNEGPLWIWTYMKYKKDKKTGTVTVQSPMMRTPNTYPVAAARGFHYCKVLSPFRVIEWIYVDSLFSKDGIKNDYLDDENLEETIDDFYSFAEDGIEFVEDLTEAIFLN